VSVLQSLAPDSAASLPTSKQPHQQILTVEQAAQYLGMTKRQVWEMTRARGQARMPLPIPVLRINGNIRFKQSSLERWVDQLEAYERTGQLPTGSHVQ
jgi:excisionase family DNA binding protein